MASSCFAREGCTGRAPDRALRGHRRPCNLGRVASPIRTNLVFGSDNLARAEAVQERAQYPAHMDVVVDDEKTQSTEFDTDHGPPAPGPCPIPQGTQASRGPL